MFSLSRYSHGHVSHPGGWIPYTLNRSGAALGESFKTFFGVWTNLARAEQAQYCDVRIDTILVCTRYLADTLGADGTAGLHDCAAGGGAEIGIITGGSGGTVRRPMQPDSESTRASCRSMRVWLVQVPAVDNVPDGIKAYQINAGGVDGEPRCLVHPCGVAADPRADLLPPSRRLHLRVL